MPAVVVVAGGAVVVVVVGRTVVLVVERAGGFVVGVVAEDGVAPATVVESAATAVVELGAAATVVATGPEVVPGAVAAVDSGRVLATGAGAVAGAPDEVVALLEQPAEARSKAIDATMRAATTLLRPGRNLDLAWLDMSNSGSFHSGMTMCMHCSATRATITRLAAPRSQGVSSQKHEGSYNHLGMRTHSTRIRRLYKVQYVFRLCVLALTIVLYILWPQSFSVLSGLGFFRGFSWLHLLWGVWLVEMAAHLVPLQGYLALGSLKHLKTNYLPAKGADDREHIRRFFRRSSVDSLKVLIAWMVVVAVIGALRLSGVVGDKGLLLVSVVFYVLDLTFVLFWCPLRACILKNRCCTTCRIFNWDHLMMFSPLLFIPGLYSLSLVGLAAVVFLVWEVCFFLHPERFSDDTNAALRCRNCRDKLCGREALPSE